MAGGQGPPIPLAYHIISYHIRLVVGICFTTAESGMWIRIRVKLTALLNCRTYVFIHRLIDRNHYHAMFFVVPVTPLTEVSVSASRNHSLFGNMLMKDDIVE